MRGSASSRTSITPGGALAGPWVKNELWRRARAVPSLDLRFAENKSLVDATTGSNLVDHTRASSGTYVGSDGLIKTAVTNLLLRSEEFDNASWTNNSLVTPNQAVAPNGTLTADLLEAGASAPYQTFSNSITTYTASIYVKNIDSNQVSLGIIGGGAGLNGTVVFSFSTNTESSAGTVDSVSSVSVGDGWYRISVTATATGAALPQVKVTQGTGDCYIWGAQLETGTTVGDYAKTTTTAASTARTAAYLPNGNGNFVSAGPLLLEAAGTNLLLRSEEFDNASWTPSGLLAFGTGSIANAAIAPDGKTTADLLTETTASGSHNIVQSATATVGATYTVSIYAKSNNRQWLILYTLGGIAASTAAWFDLQNGVVGNRAANNVNATIQSVGDGWYRCTSTWVATGSSGQLYFQLASSNGGTTYTGDGTSGIYVWGAQLEQSSYPTSYIPTTSSTATRAADVSTSAATTVFESDWYRQSEGSLYGEAQGFQSTASATALAVISDATLSNRWEIDLRAGTAGGAGRTTITSNGSNSFDTSNVASPVFVINQNYKIASAAAANNFGYSFGGGVAVQDSSGAMPISPDRMEIGNRSNALVLNGSIRRLTYWPQRLGNEVLQTITQ